MFMTGVLCTVCGAQVYFLEGMEFLIKLNFIVSMYEVNKIESNVANEEHQRKT